MATERVSLSCGSLDSISSFPDEILARILSSLPTKQAASTSILSKRWRNLFQLMNILCASFYFDDSDLLHPERDVHAQDSFRAFVDKTLFYCCNPLKKFSLICREDDADRTRGWVSKAFERGVSDLDLRVKMTYVYKKRPTLALPETVYINNTLVKLTLGTELCLGCAPDEVDLPLVKSLFLDTVWFSDFDLGDLIQGCPELEELCIHHEYIPDKELGYCSIQPPQSYIEHLNIKKVTIRYNDHSACHRHLILTAPRLIYLDYSDYLTCDGLNWGYFKSTSVFNDLVEARLNLAFSPRGRFGNELKNCSKILNFICNAHILHISSNTAKVMHECLDYWRNQDGLPFLKNLTTLHFESNNGKEYWELLSIMIEKSPKLETLVLKGLCGISNREVVNSGGNVVKVVEIQDYEGRVEGASCGKWRKLKR